MHPVFFNSRLDPEKSRGLYAFYSPWHQQGGSELIDLSSIRSHATLTGDYTWSNKGLIISGNTYRPAESHSPLITQRKLTVIASASLPLITDSSVVYMHGAWGSRGVAFKVSSGEMAITLVTVVDGWIGVTPFGDVDALHAWILSDNHFAGLSSDFHTHRYSETYNIEAMLPSTTELGNRIMSAQNSDGAVSQPTTGTLKQLYVYNRVLSVSEILEHSDPDYLFEKPKIYGFMPSSGATGNPYYYMMNQ